MMAAVRPKHSVEPFDNPRITPIAAAQKPFRTIRVNSRNSRIIQFPLSSVPSDFGELSRVAPSVVKKPCQIPAVVAKSA